MSISSDADWWKSDVVSDPRLQVILYESASLPHGRPYPLNGEKFVNAFVHYRPKGWDFVEHAHLYHLARRDHRHNFSVHFYLFYLTFDSK